MNKEQARAIIEAHDICTDEENEEMQLLAKHNPELLEAYRALALIAFPKALGQKP